MRSKGLIRPRHDIYSPKNPSHHAWCFKYGYRNIIPKTDRPVIQGHVFFYAANLNFIDVPPFTKRSIVLNCLVTVSLVFMALTMMCSVG